ncbi:predicted protein [Lichtheimia corymbifera JMRC:FSU:9682]|uniref:Uncharacterized protein n=1 Tax=Lichtheimia corymbifera JMRC:FSU:9682 TaxID=1263082 RepID=A0A068SCM8_9FUNG|nr:predicted protein [Lichtheimia corymbifera JMRC:FSU:9682]
MHDLLQAKIPSWMEAGHWQYLSWYIVLSLSTISGAAICAHAFCFKRSHIVRGDRFLSILNAIPLLISLLTAFFLEDPEPWAAGSVHFTRSSTGFLASCSVFDSNEQPLLYQRCMLADGTWLAAAVACLLWLLLACLAMSTRSSSSAVVAIEPAKEPKWGRYIPERPASLQSVNLQIVPPPPPHHLRHSVVYNTYVPRSDVSFDSQASTATYDNKRSSWYYNDDYYYTPSSPPPASAPPFMSSFDHRYPTTPSYHKPPVVPLLPMVPQMDSIELFGATPPPAATASEKEYDHFHHHHHHGMSSISPPIERESQQDLVMSPLDYNNSRHQHPYDRSSFAAQSISSAGAAYTSSKVELVEELVPSSSPTYNDTTTQHYNDPRENDPSMMNSLHHAPFVDPASQHKPQQY